MGTKQETEIRVLIVEPEGRPVVKVIENKLEELQKIVGGWIEVLPLDDTTALICNEEGKINGLPLNRPLYAPNGEMYDIVAGTFIVAGDDIESGEFVSLTDEALNRYSGIFANPKVYIRTPKGIVALDVPADDEEWEE